MEETELKPQVSVLIVSHNSEVSLRRCLAKLETSEAREIFEILVIDNGSRDGSPRLDSEFPSATFLRLPRHFGFVKALNIGMRTAKGELFFFLAPETEVHPGTIPALAARLFSQAEAAAACPLLVDPSGRPVSQIRELPSPGSIVKLALRREWIENLPVHTGVDVLQVGFPSMAALMVRSYILKGLRYIDERYGESWADAEIATQIQRASKKILLYPGIRATYHGTPERDDNQSVQALYAADWSLGAAVYAGKHYGFGVGLKVRTASMLEALGRTLLIRDLRFNASRFGYILSGQKLNGTQTDV